MGTGTQHAAEDARNEDILIYVNGVLKPRAQAVVSVFDSGFVLGDGVWEGLRVQGGHPLYLDEHLDRLEEGARALMINIGMDRDALRRAVYEVLRANAMQDGAMQDGAMQDGVHVRLMVTRGVKRTPYQDPRVTVGPATVVIVAEYKTASAVAARQGISLYTVHVRRGYPDVQDQKLNSHSKLNCITACIQAYGAGADEALMLDPHGFVATCNSTHFFIVRRGEVWTSSGQYCLGGITRAKVIALCRENDIPVQQKSFSLTDVYSADEAFVTGTFAGLVPVHTIDQRAIGAARAEREDNRGPVLQRLLALYAQDRAREVARCVARCQEAGQG